MPLKPMTLHGVRSKDLSEIVRIGRKEAKKMLNVPYVHISAIVQPCDVEEDAVIIHVREEKRR